VFETGGVLMTSVLSTDLAQLYETLPPRQRERLLAQARSYAEKLDATIRHALPVVTEPGGEGYIASDGATAAYGTGPTPEAAFSDYKAALLDAYESLLERENTLSDDLRARLDILRTVFGAD
jgi:hypothetical protein